MLVAYRTLKYHKKMNQENYFQSKACSMTQFRAMTPNYINNDVPLQKLHLEHNGKFKN